MKLVLKLTCFCRPAELSVLAFLLSGALEGEISLPGRLVFAMLAAWAVRWPSFCAGPGERGSLPRGLLLGVWLECCREAALAACSVDMTVNRAGGKAGCAWWLIEAGNSWKKVRARFIASTYERKLQEPSPLTVFVSHEAGRMANCL